MCSPRLKGLTYQSIKKKMGPNPNGPLSCDRANRYSGLGVRSMGLVGDFLESAKDIHPYSPLESDLALILGINLSHEKKKTLVGWSVFFWGGRIILPGKKRDYDKPL